MRSIAALYLIAWVGVFSPRTQAAGLPLVISATVDYTHSTLTINGQNFGSSPAVTLDALAFSTQSSASSQIVANFPSGKAPSSFYAGNLLFDGDVQESTAGDFWRRHRREWCGGSGGASRCTRIAGCCGGAWTCGACGSARNCWADGPGGSDGCNRFGGGAGSAGCCGTGWTSGPTRSHRCDGSAGTGWSRRAVRLYSSGGLSRE